MTSFFLYILLLENYCSAQTQEVVIPKIELLVPVQLLSASSASELLKPLKSLVVEPETPNPEVVHVHV